MARRPRSGSGDQPPWNPGRFALWSQRWEDADGPISVLLQHPTAPFVRHVTAIDDAALQRAASDYLEQANNPDVVDPPLGLPLNWLAALRPPPPIETDELMAIRSAFGWLPVGWPPPSFDDSTSADPIQSFVVERRSADGDTLDRAVVLLATEWLNGWVLNSEFALRIIAHVRPRNNGTFDVHITGLSASLPFGPYEAGNGVFSENWARDDRASTFRSALLESGARANVERIAGLQNVAFRGFRLARTADKKNWQVERRGTGLVPAPDASGTMTPHAFVYMDKVSEAGFPIEKGVLISKVELVADMADGDARVFPIDPASQGPAQSWRMRRLTRTEEMLDNYRVDAEITAGLHDPLEYPRATGGDMRVVVCPRFVRDDAGTNPGSAKAVDLPGGGPAIRSDDFSAVMAYWNVTDLFQRFDAYGIDANAYFRLATLPLKVAYRSGIRPGPGKDGQTVNARVLPEGWPVDLVGPAPLGQRPAIEMHLALANLSHRARRRGYAEPLGIASDLRWIWHEIGHVLLVASVSELEFRFAHSAGDALAAIVTDPRSQLASDRNWRGATFPWVFVPRRHDRDVSLGWSWGGSLHHAMAQVPDSTKPRLKGYWSEQILSSSLFRLYRCLGGDTVQAQLLNQPPDPLMRESASHYSVYLIMTGIQMLGMAALVNKPEQFVSALFDADRFTTTWTVTYPPNTRQTVPPEPTYTFERIGGCVHKVVRWAFEAQGLYAPVGTITNGPGRPPRVDVYIEDLRPTIEPTPYGSIDFGRGTYAPVSLHWNPPQGPAPLWQAKPAAIDVQGPDIIVTVGNRGRDAARNVYVSAWWCAWPANSAPPQWNGAINWTRCNPASVKIANIPPGGSRTVSLTHAPQAGRYLVFAQATCDDDRANTDTATGLPCSALPTPLVDVVANDNNLGLRVLNP